MRIALAGLGTVGAGVVKLLDENRDLIARRSGRPIEIVLVSARDRMRDRGIDLGRFEWVDDTSSLADRDDVDVVVELIGGSDGPAVALVRSAIAQGKGVVTANKAMMAHHGLELAAAAEKAGTALKYEAAVAGGIPIIKAIREGAAANRIDRVYGILNGTCNYILTEMEEKGTAFADVLGEAQRLGYAEADPTFDIDGIDAAHKLAILASLAFGSEIDFASVRTTGIRAVAATDIAHAAELGFRVRLVGLAEVVGDRIHQRVHPCLVPLTNPLSKVTGSLNAVVAEGNFVGRLFFEGRGAGEGPTASAVVADLIDIARGEAGPAFAMPSHHLEPIGAGEAGDRRGRYYLRLSVADETGVLAELAAMLRDAGVSIDSLIQRGQADAGGVFIAIVSHETDESAVRKAIEAMRASSSVLGEPMLMHILDF
ncbi:homoserine dehydrogenase [Sphingosinicella microcystinivorans]|uniref:Homoserine dehydrogenase n=1 Tax=Sphingosinicella microcystinivorans TaxID=335406 RepID=A0AAD1D5S0_SPHMI|nr:homoserine dehydrogenase [Sphingosinicella microcystinivorans]